MHRAKMFRLCHSVADISPRTLTRASKSRYTPLLPDLFMDLNGVRKLTGHTCEFRGRHPLWLRLGFGFIYEEILAMQLSTRRWLSRGLPIFSRAIGFGLVLTACSTTGWAGPQFAPEIDPGLATSAMALLGGGLAMIASRKRRK